jgi:PAS domain S-box-containing protein
MDYRSDDSERWLRESQRLALLGHYIFDIGADSWSSSEMLDELWGIGPDYPRDTEGWLRIVHPSDRERMSDYLRREVIGQGMPFDAEYRIVRVSDGVERWVHGLGKLAHDAEGRPIRMFGTIQDISERRAREDEIAQLSAQLAERLHALEAEHVRLRTVLDVLPVAVGITDADGVVVDLNPMVARIWAGSSPPRPRGLDEYAHYRGWWADTGEPLAPEDWTAAQVLRTGEPRLGDIIEIERFDGSRGVVVSSAVPLRDGDGSLVGCVGVTDDITDEHRQSVFSRALNEIGVLVYSAPSFDEVLDRGLVKAAEALGAESAAEWTRVEPGTWTVHSVYRLADDSVGAVMNDADEPYALLAIKSGDVVAVEDTWTDTRVNSRHMKQRDVRAVIAVPMMVRGVPLGVALFNWGSAPRHFVDNEVAFARQFGLMVSLALENASLYQALLAKAASK